VYFFGTTRGSKLKFNILQTAIPFSHFINARAVATFFVSNLGFGSIKTVVLSTLRGHLTDIYASVKAGTNKKAQLMLAYPRDAKTMKKIPPFRSYNKFQSSRKSGVYSN